MQFWVGADNRTAGQEPLALLYTSHVLTFDWGDSERAIRNKQGIEKTAVSRIETMLGRGGGVVETKETPDLSDGGEVGLLPTFSCSPRCRGSGWGLTTATPG